MTIPRSTLRVTSRVDGVVEVTAAKGVGESVEEMVEEVVGDVVEEIVEETVDEAAKDLARNETKPVGKIPEPKGITPVGKTPGRVDKKLWGEEVRKLWKRVRNCVYSFGAADCRRRCGWLPKLLCFYLFQGG